MVTVILESPYAGDVEKNIEYAKLCMKDSLMRNEAPLLSHLLYTMVLDDTIKEERELGIEAGLSWRHSANKTVVYTDLGISPGMQHGIQDAIDWDREIEYRALW